MFDVVEWLSGCMVFNWLKMMMKRSLVIRHFGRHNIYKSYDFFNDSMRNQDLNKQTNKKPYRKQNTIFFFFTVLDLKGVRITYSLYDIYLLTAIYEGGPRTFLKIGIGKTLIRDFIYRCLVFVFVLFCVVVVVVVVVLFCFVFCFVLFCFVLFCFVLFLNNLNTWILWIFETFFRWKETKLRIIAPIECYLWYITFANIWLGNALGVKCHFIG